MKTNQSESQTASNSRMEQKNQLRRGRKSIVRSSILMLLSTMALTQADVIEFDLSPPAGLRPGNEAPPIVGATGSGNEISGGITFDTSTSTLTLAIGYGSAAGFTDLTGAPTGMHIHGPASATTNAPVLFDLAPIHFAAADAAKGGVIYGSVVYPGDKIADLLAGSNYVNIHTSAFSGGEIRGQLIPLINKAPVVVCPANATVECGQPVTYTATVSDADGDAVEVVWSLNSKPVQTDEIEAGTPPTSASLDFTDKLPLGDNTLTVTATDSVGNISTCSSTITVVDTIPPVIVSACVSPSELWPPNHKMVPVRVRAVVTDACGKPTWKIISICSNEAAGAIGSGQTAPDRKITGDETALLRAERSGKNKAGRVYTIKIQATDCAGNKSAPATVTVTVPHSKGKAK